VPWHLASPELRTSPSRPDVLVLKSRHSTSRRERNTSAHLQRPVIDRHALRCDYPTVAEAALRHPLNGEFYVLRRSGLGDVCRGVGGGTAAVRARGVDARVQAGAATGDRRTRPGPRWRAPGEVREQGYRSLRSRESAAVQRRPQRLRPPAAPRCGSVSLVHASGAARVSAVTEFPR
jgi:hypothetical protein